MEMQMSPSPRRALTVSAALFEFFGMRSIQLQHELREMAIQRADGKFFVHTFPAR